MGQVALVTGGNRGLGFEVCRSLAREGLTVLLGSRNPSLGRGAATEAALFQQYLYEEQRHNRRIRLAFVDSLSAESVPAGLRPWQQFRAWREPLCQQGVAGGTSPLPESRR